MRSLRQVWRRASGAVPVLSVVVPVYNVADYLEECLDSLLGQSLRELEVIAVDDGSTDGSADILRRRARRDGRLRVLTQPNAGQGAARNRAVAEARGEFLTFCDADDRVPPESFAYLVDVLRATGSDLAVGRSRRFDETGLLGPVQVRGVHGTDRRGVTAAEFPEALHDLILCNRVFRTEFWRSAVGGFPEGVVYEDHLPMVTAYVRARSFDVLQRTTYHWRVRADNTSTTQQSSTLQNLRDRVAARESAHDLLRAEAPTVAYETWVARGLVAAWPGFIPGALGGDEEFRDLLARTYRTYLERADDRAMAQVQHAPRVLARLCADERWDDVAEALAYFDAWGHHPRLEISDGVVTAVPEPGLAFVEHVPPELWRLADREMNLLAGFRSARWVAPAGLELTGFLAIRGIDAGDSAPTVAAHLVDVESGARIAVDSRVERDPEVNQWVRHANADYDHGRFVVRVDAAALPPSPATWALVLDVRHRGIAREGQVYDFVAGAPFWRETTGVVGGHLVRAGRDDEHGLVVEVAAAPAGSSPPAVPPRQVADVAVEHGQVVVRFAGEQADALPSSVHLTGKRGRVALEQLDDGRPGWRLPVATVPGSGVYDVRCEPGEPVLATPSEDLAARVPFSVLTSDVRVTVKVRVNGALRLDVGPPLDGPERTALGQRRLQRRHRDGAGADVVDPDLVLLRAFGEDVEDTAGFVSVAPRAGRACWTVADLSEPVPAGTSAVVAGSRQWYDALGTAAVLVTGAAPPPWFRLRPGQRLLSPETD